MLFDISQECFFFGFDFHEFHLFVVTIQRKELQGASSVILSFNKYTIVSTSFSSVYNCEHLFYSFLYHSAYIWFLYIYNHYSSLWWYLWTQFNDQLPVSLLAQLVTRCTMCFIIIFQFVYFRARARNGVSGLPLLCWKTFGEPYYWKETRQELGWLWTLLLPERQLRQS